MDFDVIIVSFRCENVLENCLNSLTKLEKEKTASITVIENGEIALADSLKKQFKDVKWIENKKNCGFAKGCNQGIKFGRAPFLCLINPDTVIQEPFFHKATEYFQSNPDTAVIGPLIIDPDGTVQGSARRFPSILTAFFGRNTLLSRIFPSNPITKANVLCGGWQASEEPVTPDWVSGACMLVRRKAALETGLMDEQFFIYWEDCDWCRRFKMDGWKIVYHPGLGPVVHSCGASSKKASFFSAFHFHRSAARLYRKYDRSPLKFMSHIVFAGASLRFILVCLKMALSGR